MSWGTIFGSATNGSEFVPTDKDDNPSPHERVLCTAWRRVFHIDFRSLKQQRAAHGTPFGVSGRPGPMGEAI